MLYYIIHNVNYIMCGKKKWLANFQMSGNVRLIL